MPERIKTVLPARNAFFRGTPMLDEEQASADFQQASHFFQRKANLRNAAASPCHYNRIQTAVGERNTTRPSAAPATREIFWPRRLLREASAWHIYPSYDPVKGPVAISATMACVRAR